MSFALLPTTLTMLCAGMAGIFLVLGVLVPCVCELVLLWCARMPREYHNAQALMKFVMLMGALYSFVIVRML